MLKKVGLGGGKGAAHRGDMKERSAQVSGASCSSYIAYSIYAHAASYGTALKVLVVVKQRACPVSLERCPIELLRRRQDAALMHSKPNRVAMQSCF